MKLQYTRRLYKYMKHAKIQFESIFDQIDTNQKINLAKMYDKVDKTSYHKDANIKFIHSTYKHDSSK